MASDDDQETPWARRLTAQIGQRLKQGRGLRNITARELAERCEQLGYRIEYQVIANIETGRRAYVGIAELLVFAAALEVPPALLLYPVGSGPAVEATPGADRGSGWDSYRLFTGELGVPSLGHRADGTPSPTTQDYPDNGILAVYRRHDRFVSDWHRHEKLNPEAAVAHLEALRAVRREMTLQGWDLPILGPEIKTALTSV